jgi:hypothetical protein
MSSSPSVRVTSFAAQTSASAKETVRSCAVALPDTTNLSTAISSARAR